MSATPLTAIALQMPSADGSFERTTIERRQPGPHDVVIRVRWAGICHSDIHVARNEWGHTSYPAVVGHEIIGEVQQLGEQVTGLAVGDAVGVGCFVESCGACRECRDGHENLCENGVTATYNSPLEDGSWTLGGYSTLIVVRDAFVLRIPEELNRIEATPLLCAGITTYAPLHRWGAGPGKRVAVIGLGGLGHVGVKIAAAMGAEVTVLSQSTAKKEDSLRFGAVDHRSTADPQTFEDLAGAFDLVLNTVSADIPIDDHLRLVARHGVLCSLGLPSEPYSVRPGSLIGQEKVLTGSMVGGIAETQQMLDFCAEHGILPQAEVVDAADVDETYDRVVSSQARYRCVIDVESTLAQA